MREKTGTLISGQCVSVCVYVSLKTPETSICLNHGIKMLLIIKFQWLIYAFNVQLCLFSTLRYLCLFLKPQSMFKRYDLLTWSFTSAGAGQSSPNWGKTHAVAPENNAGLCIWCSAIGLEVIVCIVVCPNVCICVCPCVCFFNFAMWIVGQVKQSKVCHVGRLCLLWLEAPE